MTLPQLELPDTLNYIGLFLSLECNLNCSYCINDPKQSGQRETIFPILPQRQQNTLTPDQWAVALKRIPYRQDLPITLQGGEPLLYWKGRGVGQILSQTPHYFDLLTNFALKPEQFAACIAGQQKKLQRNAPYPSIRVSYHAEEMDRVWHGRGFAELVDRCEALSKFGFQVSPTKAESDVGIYMVAHPENRVTSEMEAIVAGRVPFETKEFLGVHDGQLHGHYLYPFSTDLIARGFAQDTLQCECRTTELLLDPLGFVWSCHYHLYASWEAGGPKREFSDLSARGFRFSHHAREIFPPGRPKPIGHLLDPDFTTAELAEYRACNQYGRCIGCDTKIKNDRFQNYYDQGIPHTSVQMRNIHFPPQLQTLVPDDDLRRISTLLHPDCRTL